MPRGFSIHIGLNYVNAKHYGHDGRLSYCANDAKVMKHLAQMEGYEVLRMLLNKNATSTNVLGSLAEASDKLKSGDILLLTYSGHGGYFPDLNDDEENDKYDETWILYDRMLIDDEIYFEWSKFREGVRILLISDSCHSGTVAKPLLLDNRNRELDLPHSSSLVEILKAEALLLYKRHIGMYDSRLKFVPSPGKISIKASVILLAGCRDNQFCWSQARSGRNLSLFTDELLTVYEKGIGNDTYLEFIEKIKCRIPDKLRQTPNYFTTGKSNTRFENQRPFLI